MIYIRPYRRWSLSARRLARRAGLHILDRPHSTATVINWGSSKNLWGPTILNKPDAVANAVDKTRALAIMKDSNVRVPEFTTDKTVATGWLRTSDVYCRTLTRASGGRGIVIAQRGATTLPDAPLYTRGVQSQNEYRLHVFNDDVIDYTKKIPISRIIISNKPDALKIRSHQNGWTFARNIQHRGSLITQATRAVKALGLDFGAVDIITNEEDKPVVLEVNCAPGLEGRTLEGYYQAINKFQNERRLP